jgi:hypothetical protein
MMAQMVCMCVVLGMVSSSVSTMIEMTGSAMQGSNPSRDELFSLSKLPDQLWGQQSPLLSG